MEKNWGKREIRKTLMLPFANIEIETFIWGSNGEVNSMKSCCFICEFLLHGYIYNILHVYGTDGVNKTDEFSANFHRGEGGEGGHLQSKILCCVFWTFKQGFWARNWEKNCNMIFENEDRLELFWKFIRFGDDICPYWWYHKWLSLQELLKSNLYGIFRRREG